MRNMSPHVGRAIGWGAIVALAGLVACGGTDVNQDPTSPVADGGNGGEASTSVGGGGQGGGQGGGGASGFPDGNTSCVEAMALTASSPIRDGAADVLDGPGDRDFFRFSATEGEWFQIVATPDFAGFESVVRVWTSDGQTLLGTGSAAYPVGNTSDPTQVAKGRIYFRAAETADYCLEVLHRDEWKGEGEGVTSPAGYRIERLALDETITQWNNGTEPNDGIEQAQSLGYEFGPSYRLAYLAGVFETEDDEDFFAFETDDAGVMFVATSPMGTGSPGLSGHASTVQWGMLTLYDANGEVVAEVDPKESPLGTEWCAWYSCGMGPVRVPSAGSYYLAVRKSAGPLGDNPSYRLRMSFQKGFFPMEGGLGPAPTDDGSNDVEAGAETPMPFQGGFLFGGSLTEGDVDYWELPVVGADVELECRSERAGSSVRGLRVTVTDRNGIVSDRSQVEHAGTGIYWSSRAPKLGLDPNPGLTVTAASSLRIRIENDAAVPDDLGSYQDYTCTVRVLTGP